MREACLYNKWCFCSNIFENWLGIILFFILFICLFIYLFFCGGGRWQWWVPMMGHSPRMRSGGSGDGGSLPNSFGCEFILFIKTHFYGEHSLHISCRITGFCAGNSPVTAGNSPVTSHRQWRGALMFSLIYAWTNGWVNNQDAGDLRRHRAHYDATVMWCRIVIQWSGQPRDLSAFNASLLSNF